MPPKPDNREKATASEVLKELSELCNSDKIITINFALLTSRIEHKRIPTSVVYAAIADLRKEHEADRTKLALINNKIQALEDDLLRKKRSAEKNQKTQEAPPPQPGSL